VTMILRVLAVCAAFALTIAHVGSAQRAKSQHDSSQGAGRATSIVDAAQLTGREDIAVRSHVVPGACLHRTASHIRSWRLSQRRDACAHASQSGIHSTGNAIDAIV
jgi:hypothetical protein